MKKALSLSLRGMGHVSPNPMVGAVVVKNGQIVGQGYHRKYGEAHAEVDALANAGIKAKGATLYVSLEPCCHFGKTPPCSDLIIKSGITKVVFAMDDPNPIMKKCSGRQVLEKAGIEVCSGLLEKEATIINEKFVKYIQKKVPYLTLKIAETINGKIADRNGQSKWISNSASRERVQFLRFSNDAIMVGIGTVLKDNPSLEVRYKNKKKKITKIIIDKKLDIPSNSRLFESKDKIIIVTSQKYNSSQKVELFKKQGVDFIFLDAQENYFDMKIVLKELGARDISSVLVEGGSKLANSILSEGLIDKMILFIAPKIMADNHAIPAFHSLTEQLIENVINLKLISVEQIEEDIVLEYKIKQ